MTRESIRRYILEMKSMLRFLPFLALLLFVLPNWLFGRDWYEPFEVLNPLYYRAYSQVELFPGGYAETIYTNQLFSDSKYDAFQINTRAGHTVVGTPSFAFSATYGAYLMNGPVNEGGTPGSRLQWLMNAVQFEYGFHAVYDAGPLFLLAEYSRTSQHPIRDNFSEVSADLVKVGVAAPEIRFRGVSIRGLLRVGYADIFDFWESRLEDPRTMWLAQPSVRAELEGPDFLNLLSTALFLEADGEIAVARGTRGHERGEIVGNGAGKLGLRLRGFSADRLRRPEGGPATGPGTLDIYLDYYGSDNSEIRDDERTPVQLFGYAIRFRHFY